MGCSDEWDAPCDSGRHLSQWPWTYLRGSGLVFLDLYPDDDRFRQRCREFLAGLPAALCPPPHPDSSRHHRVRPNGTRPFRCGY